MRFTTEYEEPPVNNTAIVTVLLVFSTVPHRSVPAWSQKTMLQARRHPALTLGMQSKSVHEYLHLLRVSSAPSSSFSAVLNRAFLCRSLSVRGEALWPGLCGAAMASVLIHSGNRPASFLGYQHWEVIKAWNFNNYCHFCKRRDTVSSSDLIGVAAYKYPQKYKMIRSRLQVQWVVGARSDL